MKVNRDTIEIRTEEGQQFLDVTKSVQEVVRRSGVRNGLLLKPSWGPFGPSPRRRSCPFAPSGLFGQMLGGIISSYIFTRPFAGWLIQPDVDPGYYAIRLSRTW
jgi:hypothetical protein